MRTLKTELQKVGIIFIAGGFVYEPLEQIFGSFMVHVISPLLNFLFKLNITFPEGKSFDANVSMIIVGGMALVILGYINEIKALRKLPFWLHCVIGALIITGLEELSGQILNLGLFFGLHLKVWDYKWMPLSSPSGQTNVFFSLIWLGLSPVCFWLDDKIRMSYKTINISDSGKVKTSRKLMIFNAVSQSIKKMKRRRKEEGKKLLYDDLPF